MLAGRATTTLDQINSAKKIFMQLITKSFQVKLIHCNLIIFLFHYVIVFFIQWWVGVTETFSYAKPRRQKIDIRHLCLFHCVIRIMRFFKIERIEERDFEH